MENINLNVGKRLKSIRQNKELSLDEVSNLTNVSKPALAQIERGASSPTINTLWKISKGLIPIVFVSCILIFPSKIIYLYIIHQ